MKIRIQRITQWRGCKIYVMNFDTVFQYLFIYNNEIYQDHIIYKPTFFRWFINIIGITERPYTREQIEEAEKMVLDGAVKSIDTLKSPKEQSKK